jgi:hypothetical protein
MRQKGNGLQVGCASDLLETSPADLPPVERGRRTMKWECIPSSALGCQSRCLALSHRLWLPPLCRLVLLVSFMKSQSACGNILTCPAARSGNVCERQLTGRCVMEFIAIAEKENGGV